MVNLVKAREICGIFVKEACGKSGESLAANPAKACGKPNLVKIEALWYSR